MEADPDRLEQVSTPELVSCVLREARDLVRVEVELMRADVRAELIEAQRSAVAFAVAGVAGMLAFALGVTAVVLALGGTWWAALVVGIAVAGVGAGAARAGYVALPKDFLSATRRRLQSDVDRLKGHAI
jgi:hypothetical protein